jgi:hypothetical protein
MALNDEEKAALAALQAKAEEPDPDDDFEIEIYDGAKGARLPYRQGKSFLAQFGIGLDPDPGKESGQGDDDKGNTSGGKSKTNSGKTGSAGTSGGTGGKESEAQGYWSKRTRRESA